MSFRGPQALRDTYKKVGVGAPPDPSYTWLVPDALRGSYEVHFHRGDSSPRIIIRLRAASRQSLKRFRPAIKAQSSSAQATSRTARISPAPRPLPNCSTKSPGLSWSPATSPIRMAARKTSRATTKLGAAQNSARALPPATTSFILQAQRRTSIILAPPPGDPKTGYYSYELGAWHIIVLNSECKDVGGCEVGAPQEKWLRADLAAHPSACTLAYWHKPLFSSGSAHGNDLTVKPLWQALYDANADVIVNGHDHDYERFAPQTPDGAPDPQRGIREFVVGTGGKNHRPFGDVKPNSEVRDATAFGVLKLTLKAGAYDWQFIPEAGKSFTDSGSGVCH